MVSPLSSIAANLKPQNQAMAFGDILRNQSLANAQLKTQDLNQQNIQQQMNMREQAAGAQQEQLQGEKALAAARYLNGLGKQLLSTDESQWNQILQPNLPQLQQLGYKPEMLQGMTREQVMSVVQQTEPLIGMQTGASRVQSSETLPGGVVIKTMSNGNIVVEDAQGNVLQGKAAQDAIEKAEERGIELQGGRAGARTRSTLEERSKLEPEVAEKIEIAKQRAKNLVATEKEERSNTRARAVYESGLSSLVNAFDQATTGPMLGLLPAVGSDGRVLEGAIRVMSPILKDVFRSAGEGTFSEGDRIQLEQMLPDRSDRQESAMKKLQQVDTVVQLKLGGDPRSVEEIMSAAQTGQPQQGEAPTPQPQAQSTLSDEQLFKKYGIN